MRARLFSLFLWGFVKGIGVRVGAETYTIDDADPRVTYLDESWNNEHCTTCNIKPDPSLATDGTWHDNTRLINGSTLSVTVQFVGNGVQAVGILASGNTKAILNIDLAITLDELFMGSIQKSPTSQTDFQYNVPLFSNQNLDNGQHTLSLSLNPNSALLIDSFIISLPDGEPIPVTPTISGQSTTTSANIPLVPQATSQSTNPSSTTSNSDSAQSNTSTSSTIPAGLSATAIAGIIIGGLIGIVIFVACSFLVWRQWQNRGHRLVNLEPWEGSSRNRSSRRMEERPLPPILESYQASESYEPSQTSSGHSRMESKSGQHSWQHQDSGIRITASVNPASSEWSHETKAENSEVPPHYTPE